MVGPTTTATGRPSVPRTMSAMNPHSSTTASRVLQHLELLEIAVTVAATLEQEVAVAKRAGRAEQRLRARRDVA